EFFAGDAGAVRAVRAIGTVVALVALAAGPARRAGRSRGTGGALGPARTLDDFHLRGGGLATFRGGGVGAADHREDHGYHRDDTRCSKSSAKRRKHLWITPFPRGGAATR